MLGTVYRGHDNPAQLLLERYVPAKRRTMPLDLSSVTRLVLALPDATPEPIVFDTTLVPSTVLTWGTTPGVVELNLREYAIPAGVYSVSLVAYSPEWPNGMVLLDHKPSTMGDTTTLEFREVLGTGILPPPVPAPVSDAVAIKSNGTTVVDAASVIDFLGDISVTATGGGGVSVTVTVAITSADVTEALGYTPLSESDLPTPPTLATVASTGSYEDLIDTPTIPSSPEDIGAATAAQGGLADTAIQPGDQANELHMPTASILGRGTAASGPVEYLTLGPGLKLEAGVLDTDAPEATGIVSVGAGTGIAVSVADPANPQVSLSPAVLDTLDLADSALQPEASPSALHMPTAGILGRTTAATGPVEVLAVSGGLALTAGNIVLSAATVAELNKIGDIEAALAIING